MRNISLDPSNHCSIYSKDIIDKLQYAQSFISNMDKNKLEFDTMAVEACNPIEDFFKSTSFVYLMAALVTILVILFVLCSFVCCKYRKLKYEYYERVSILQSNKAKRHEPSQFHFMGMSFKFGGSNMTYKHDSEEA